MSTTDTLWVGAEAKAAAGQVGGLTGRKNTAPARLARLRQYGAAFAPDGTLDAAHPDTVRARQLIAAHARLARAQKAARQEGR